MWQAAILLWWFNDFKGVIFWEEEDLAFAHAKVLFLALMHGFLEVGIEAERLFQCAKPEQPQQVLG